MAVPPVPPPPPLGLGGARAPPGPYGRSAPVAAYSSFTLPLRAAVANARMNLTLENDYGICLYSEFLIEKET